MCDLSTTNRVWIYAGLLVFSIISNFARVNVFYAVTVNASRVLHNRMFASVLRAPMQFFDTNPIGEAVYTVMVKLDSSDYLQYEFSTMCI